MKFNCNSEELKFWMSCNERKDIWFWRSRRVIFDLVFWNYSILGYVSRLFSVSVVVENDFCQNALIYTESSVHFKNSFPWDWMRWTRLFPHKHIRSKLKFKPKYEMQYLDDLLLILKTKKRSHIEPSCDKKYCTYVWWSLTKP